MANPSENWIGSEYADYNTDRNKSLEGNEEQSLNAQLHAGKVNNNLFKGLSRVSYNT